MPKGNVALIILLLAIPVVLFLLFNPLPSKTTPNNTTQACIVPDQTKVISYDFSSHVINDPPDTIKPVLRTRAYELPYQTITGDFQRIRDVTAIPKAVFPFHFGEAGHVTYQGTDRQVFVSLTECDGTIPTLPNPTCNAANKTNVASVNFSSKPTDTTGAGAFNLIYLMVDDDKTKVPVQDPAYHYLEIFLKKGAAIPEYIKQYCQQYGGDEFYKNTTDQFFLPGGTQTGQPPLFINTAVNSANITEKYDRRTDSGLDDSLEAHRKNEGMGNKYKLVGYAPIDSPVATAQRLIGNLASAGPIKGLYQDGQTTYYLGYVSFARFFTLINENSPFVVYYYQITDNTTDTTVPQTSSDPTLQLKTLNPYNVNPFGWWTPECKPAIYLYPETTTNFNVKVDPQGFLTYTNPKYPTGGWDVIASPNGQIQSQGQNYDYLYYESKIHDQLVKIPETGFVTSYQDLKSLYQNLLPKLGLNGKETQDFVTYWQKALPYAPYYFVGVMNEASINSIEPLTITPTLQTNIRVRLYFKPMDVPTAIPAPVIVTPVRIGPTMVEWGGMVKNDKNHPFTCSQ